MMKKTLLISVLSLAFSFSMSSQEKVNWKKTNDTNIEILETVKRDNFPTDYELLDFNINAFKAQLLNVPKRAITSNSNSIVTIPLSGTEFEDYRFFEVSNFDEVLQSQYPNIRSYVGVGIENPANTVRVSLDPRGVQMMIIRADKPTVFIEPYSTNAKTYAVYTSGRNVGKLPFTCSTEDQQITADFSSKIPSTSRSSSGQLLNFRLALSCTAEYANYFGATSSAQFGLVLAAYNATLTRVNGVFEKDFAIHLNIIAESSNIAFYNASTDPYSDASVGTDPLNSNNELGWGVQLQNAISSTLTGVSSSLVANNAAYDVGHLFGASGGGGNAGCIGCVCRNDTSSTGDKNKGSGYTSPGNSGPLGDRFDIDYVAHELGHQFGANHTFSNAVEGTNVNVEPGSGSTIMGYAGITPYDAQAVSDDYFHAVSIAQVQTNMASKTCPTITTISHGAPVVSSGGNWTIPKSTPFMLTGSATDAGGTGSLTYCWEQVDTGNSSTIDAASAASPTKTVGPNFRSYSPTTSPTRYFPRLQSTLNNSQTTQGPEIVVEALNSNARTLNFRLTARDNVAGQGQTNFANAAVTINAFVGPFNVTSQNTVNAVWPQGSTQTITWNVGGTTALVGSTNVDILLSTDGGLTYPTVLVANTPNDGTQTITAPSINAPKCRIMVKPTGNIYFDINEKDFSIGNYTIQLQTVCTDYVFPINQAITENASSLYTTPGGLQIDESYTITDINVRITATHPNISELRIAIKGPWQASLDTALWYNAPCSAQAPANMDLIFDSQGSPVNCANTTNLAPTIPSFAPQFAAFVGNNSSGTWNIYISDYVLNGNNAGTLLNGATINLCRSELGPVLATNNFQVIDDLVLYPNPNNGNFNIQFNATSNKVSVEVHDIRGRKVYDQTFESTGLFNESLNLKNTQAGIYIVSIIDGNRKDVKKIIVN